MPKNELFYTGESPHLKQRMHVTQKPAQENSMLDSSFVRPSAKSMTNRFLCFTRDLAPLDKYSSRAFEQ